MVHDSRSHRLGALALVGPGRAGTTRGRSRSPPAAGRRSRSPAARSTRRRRVAAAERLGAPRGRRRRRRSRRRPRASSPRPTPPSPTPRSRSPPGCAPGALVVHLSGACPLEELDKLQGRAARRRVGVAAPAPVVPVGRARRRPAAGFVVRGRRPARGRAPRALARACARSASRDAERAAYHAAATIASNHLVALLGQAVRVAEAAGVPPEALLPLVRATRRQRRRARCRRRAHRARWRAATSTPCPPPRRAAARRARRVPRAGRRGAARSAAATTPRCTPSST